MIVFREKIYNKTNIKNKISFSLTNSSADFYSNEDFIIDNYFNKSKKIYIKNIS